MTDFNFFSAYNKIAERNQKRIVILTVFAALIMFILVCVFVVYSVFELRMQGIRYEINANSLFMTSSDTIEKLDHYAELNVLLDDMRAYNASVELLSKQIVDNSFIKTGLFRSITANMTKDVSIVSLSAYKNLVNLNAFGGNEVSIAQFEYNIAALSFVKSVFIESIVEVVPNEVYSFTMSIELRDVAADVWDE